MPWWAWILLAMGWMVAAAVHVLARRLRTDESVRSSSIVLSPFVRALLLGASTLCVVSPLVPIVRGNGMGVVVFWFLAVVPAVALITVGAFLLMAPSIMWRRRRPGHSG